MQPLSTSGEWGQLLALGAPRQGRTGEGLLDRTPELQRGPARREAGETAPATLAAHLPGAAVLPGGIRPGGLCKGPFGNAEIPPNSRELLERLNGADAHAAPESPSGQLSPRN